MADGDAVKGNRELTGKSFLGIELRTGFLDIFHDIRQPKADRAQNPTEAMQMNSSNSQSPRDRCRVLTTSAYHSLGMQDQTR